MTIHGSKGLEAPVVILADADSKGTHTNAWTSLVDWPADADRPVCFQLLLDSRSTDRLTERSIERRMQLQQREEYNLLYVAMTRARQYLVVSATENPSAHSSGWYRLLHSGLGSISEPGDDGGIILQHGQLTAAESVTAEAAAPATRRDASVAELRYPLPPPRRSAFISPSETDAHELSRSFQEEDGTLRGSVIHRALELMSGREFTPATLRQMITAEFTVADQAKTDAWLKEAETAYNASVFDEIFRPARTARACNEVPVLYERDGEPVYGIIDRLVIDQDRVLVIDYKTHRVDAEEQIEALLEHYRSQLRYYRNGVRQLWPAKSVDCALLLTHCNRLTRLAD
jgi:ATP-dependent helicase/nuclease subunit A